MSIQHPRMIRMFVGAIFVVLMIAAAASSQKPAAGPGRDHPPPVPKDVSPGISACATCHSGADQRGVELFVTQHKSHEFVRLDESQIWRGRDVHSIAFQSLSGPVGERMSRALGYDVTKAAQCLTCHSVDLTPNAPSKDKHFFTTQGVNCTGCHGLKETWQIRHYKEAADGTGILWRTTTPAEKAEAGMIDLRNPAIRAKKCVSCHIANPDEGKLVTHDMYAAGHPPLPPFELATFQEGEPRHWGYPSELPFFKTVPKEKSWPLYRYHPAELENYQARQMAAGAIASLRAETQKLLAEAREARKPDADGMDYASFDCYACHHELRSKSDRQADRAMDGRGGRPTIRKASGVLAAVVAEHAELITAGGLKDRSIGFVEKWGKLRSAVVANSAVRPARIEIAATEMLGWCDEFLSVIEKSAEPIYSNDQATRLLAMITKAVEEQSTADPDAALVLSWAYYTLRTALKGPPPETWLKEYEKVTLSGVRNAPPPPEGNLKNVPVPSQYGRRMDWIAEFESTRFRDGMRGLIKR